MNGILPSQSFFVVIAFLFLVNFIFPRIHAI